MENNNLEFKYQNLDQKNFLNLNFKIQNSNCVLRNWNSSFQIQIIKQRIPITMDENKPKNHPIDRMKFLIIAS
jgi:hypothetical protein